MQRFLSYVLAGFIISTMISVSLPKIFGWVLIAIFAVKFFGRERFNFPDAMSIFPAEKWLLALFAVISLSLFLADATPSLKLQQLLTARYIFLLFALHMAFLSIPVNSFEKLLPWWVGLVCVVAVYGVIQTHIGFDLVRPTKPLHLQFYSGGNLFRIRGFFHHPVTFAHAFSIALCFPIAVFLTFGSWRDRMWQLATFTMFVGILAVIWSYTRGAWIALLAAALVMAAFKLKKIIPLLSIALVGLLITFAVRPEGFSERASSVTSATYSSNYIRLEIWKANIAMFNDHPIFGVGYHLNENFLQQYFAKLGIVQPFSGHAHNVFLQFLAGVGIVGFALFLGFIIYSFHCVLKEYLVARRENSDRPWDQAVLLACIGAQVEIWVGGLTDVTFVDFSVNQVYLLTLAFTFALIARRRNFRQQSSFNLRTLISSEA